MGTLGGRETGRINPRLREEDKQFTSGGVIRVETVHTVIPVSGLQSQMKTSTRLSA
jgi:hypothetical protein